MPTNSISGSLGAAGAGATVFLTLNITGGDPSGYAGLWMEQAETVADGSGNYSFAGLTSNPFDFLGVSTNGSVVGYRITPVLFGAEFTPFSSDQVLSGSDITGVNFSVSSHYSLVQEYVADFSGTHNPLPNWTQVSDDPTGLQTVGGLCQALGDDADGTTPSGAYPSVYVPSSADCYSKSTLGAMNDQDLLAAEIRADSSAASLGFGIEYYGSAGTPNDGGLQVLDIAANNALMTGLGFLNVGTFPHTWQIGDAVILITRGQNTYAFLNPAAAPSTYIPLGGGTSTNSPAVGFTPIQLDVATSDFTTSSWSAFSAGKVIAASPGSGGGSSCMGLLRLLGVN
jgi:hypothetical protein